MPDRQPGYDPEAYVKGKDFVRWKHKWTRLNLGLFLTAAAATVIALLAMGAANRATESVISAKAEVASAQAEVAKVKVDLTTALSEQNSIVIYNQCVRINSVIAGVRTFVDSLVTQSPRRDQILEQFDHDNPQEPCPAPSAPGGVEVRSFP